MMQAASVTARQFARNQLACAAALGLLLTGCTGSLLQSSTPAADTFRLGSTTSPAPTAGEASTPLVYGIVVTRPRSSGSLDTDRIAVRAAGNRFDYYTGARWASSAPQMLQEQLVEALVATGQFGGGVFAAPARVPTELLLDVELRRFEAVTTSADAATSSAAPVVHVQVQASLVDSRRGVRVTSFISEATVPATENRLAAVIAAFERANAEVVTEVGAKIQAAATGLPQR